MKINNKGQLTIPHAVRIQAGLLPQTEVQFEIGLNGEVILRAARQPAQDLRAAFSRVRGSANATQFKGMGTDEFMAIIRGNASG